MKFDYTITTAKTFDEAVLSVQDEIAKAGMRPIILPQFFPQADLGDKPKEVDQIIQNIINNAK